MRSLIGGTIADIQRNHALEHGTVTILLTRRGPVRRLVGRAVPDGFYIYGNVPGGELLACAREALARFQQGERDLALTHLCGTNIAVAGLLSATGAAVALGKQTSLARIPNAVSLATLGVTLSQPVGRWVQERLTTRADLENMEIVGMREGVGGRVHKVVTRSTRTGG